MTCFRTLNRKDRTIHLATDKGHIVQAHGAAFGVSNRGTRRYPDWFITDLRSGTRVYSNELIGLSDTLFAATFEVIKSEAFGDFYAEAVKSDYYKECVSVFESMCKQSPTVESFPMLEY